MTTQIVESCKRAQSSDTILSFKHLPIEILIEILLKLPVKAPIKVTCVCKTWYSVVNDSHFITTHLNQSTLNGDNHPVHLPTSPSGKRCCSMLSMDTLDGLSIHEIPFNPEFDTFRIAGSRNGSSTMATPFTCGILPLRKSTSFAIPVFRENPTRLLFLDSGFITRQMITGLLEFYTILINTSTVGKGTLSTISWRKIEADGIDFPDEQSMSVFVNGAVHGKASRGSPERIMSFNFADEKFGEIMLPRRESDMERATVKESIGVFKELLALFRWYGESKNCQVWVMRENGVADSWTKQFLIDVRERIFQPLCFNRNDECSISYFGIPKFECDGDLLMEETCKLESSPAAQSGTQMWSMHHGDLAVTAH
ncbi:hypothetical protein RJ639_034277 [Escallonia herrerae]|uniref:F-box domain-containing protein n=1 Tax=Escallonia herrerae TaxID=1293975 RepID=A0AA89BEV0_9ASTE|nr:hypothetical protein RJ639_034277 [Escallonia herrerae]